LRKIFNIHEEREGEEEEWGSRGEGQGKTEA
jgi:hypothetical protein